MSHLALPKNQFVFFSLVITKNQDKYLVKYGMDSRVDRAGAWLFVLPSAPGSNPAQAPQVKQIIKLKNYFFTIIWGI